MSKLYRVRMVYDELFLADSVKEAKDLALYAARHEIDTDPTVESILPFYGPPWPNGWNSRCCPWGIKTEKTIAEILATEDDAKP